MSLEAISIKLSQEAKPDHLLVMLHGWGANYYDLEPLAQLLNLPNYQFFFPNAPFPHPQIPEGRAWYALETNDRAGLAASRQKLQEWLSDLEATTGIPLARTILAGFSQGGAMILDVGLSLPLAALCSLSGYLHSSPQINSERTPPVLIVHGRQDPIVPLPVAQKARDELVARGIKVQYQEFEMGHEIQPAVLSLLREFILAIESN